MNELHKLATGLWALVDPHTPFTIENPAARRAVWAMLPHVKAAAIRRYLGAPLYERPALHRDMIKASRLCGDLAGLLKEAELPPDPGQGPEQPGNPQAPPAPPPGPGQPAPGQPGPGQPQDPMQAESHVDSVAAMIGQSQAAGGQIAPGEIANALQQAGQQDLQGMMGTIQQQIDEHVAMYVQQLTAPPPPAMPGPPGVMPAPPMPGQAPQQAQPPMPQQQPAQPPFPPKTAGLIALGLRGR